MSTLIDHYKYSESNSLLSSMQPVELAVSCGDTKMGLLFAKNSFLSGLSALEEQYKAYKMSLGYKEPIVDRHITALNAAPSLYLAPSHDSLMVATSGMVSLTSFPRVAPIYELEAKISELRAMVSEVIQTDLNAVSSSLQASIKSYVPSDYQVVNYATTFWSSSTTRPFQVSEPLPGYVALNVIIHTEDGSDPSTNLQVMYDLHVWTGYVNLTSLTLHYRRTGTGEGETLVHNYVTCQSVGWVGYSTQLVADILGDVDQEHADGLGTWHSPRYSSAGFSKLGVATAISGSTGLPWRHSTLMFADRALNGDAEFLGFNSAIDSFGRTVHDLGVSVFSHLTADATKFNSVYDSLSNVRDMSQLFDTYICLARPVCVSELILPIPYDQLAPLATDYTYRVLSVQPEFLALEMDGASLHSAFDNFRSSFPNTMVTSAHTGAFSTKTVVIFCRDTNLENDGTMYATVDEFLGYQAVEDAIDSAPEGVDPPDNPYDTDDITEGKKLADLLLAYQTQPRSSVCFAYARAVEVEDAEITAIKTAPADYTLTFKTYAYEGGPEQPDGLYSAVDLNGVQVTATRALEILVAAPVVVVYSNTTETVAVSNLYGTTSLSTACMEHLLQVQAGEEDPFDMHQWNPSRIGTKGIPIDVDRDALNRYFLVASDITDDRILSIVSNSAPVLSEDLLLDMGYTV